MPSFTVGSGARDYATVSLAYNDLSGIDHGEDVTLLCSPNENVGSNYTLSGTPINPFIIRTDGVDFNGSNGDSLSITSRVNLSAPNVTFKHIKIDNNNNFDNAISINGQNSFGEDVYIEDSSASGTTLGAVNLSGSQSNKGLRRFVINGTCSQLIRTGFNRSAILEDGVGFGATVHGVFGFSGGTSNQAFSRVHFFNCNNSAFNGTFVDAEDLASDDSTTSITPYGESEYVDFSSGNYQTKSSSFLATAAAVGGLVGAYLQSGGGVSVDITEAGPSFTESISANLSPNIIVSISESGPSFAESISANLSSLTIQSSIVESGPSFVEQSSLTVTPSLNINASISESGPSFLETSAVDLSKNISIAITENGPSFIENINTSIKKDITSTITEFGPSFNENITVKIPIKITLNPKNVVRVKRKSNTVKIKRTNNVIRVK